jgi:hypothetical protein
MVMYDLVSSVGAAHPVIKDSTMIAATFHKIEIRIKATVSSKLGNVQLIKEGEGVRS